MTEPEPIPEKVYVALRAYAARVWPHLKEDT